jgi:hypothetical protein
MVSWPSYFWVLAQQNIMVGVHDIGSCHIPQQPGSKEKERTVRDSNTPFMGTPPMI